MSKQKFIEAMGHVDDRILERYVKAEDGLTAKRPRKMWVRWVAAAACFALITCLLVSGILGGLFPNSPILPTSGSTGPSIQMGVPSTPTSTTAPTRPTFPNQTTAPTRPTFPNQTTAPTIPPDTIPYDPPFVIPDPPVYLDAAYTAQEIARLFPVALGSPTSYYQRIYTGKAEYLDICPIPQGETIPIFQHNSTSTAMEKTEFQDFVEQILPKLSNSLGIERPDYTIVERDYGTPGSRYWHTTIDTEGYSIFFSRYTFALQASFYNDVSKQFVFDGEPVQIDQRQSNEEILTSLDIIKKTLFDILGVSFSDSKVVRKYYEYNANGNTYNGVGIIDIYFFNEDGSSLNTLLQTGYAPQSDYIQIRFDNYTSMSGALISEGILTPASISYVKNHTTESYQRYQVKSQARLIPLEEAEALLYNGYVFGGGHGCPLCMAAQDKVDFEGYDYVGLEYIFGRDNGQFTEGIPFYAFYELIGTAENGNLIYAKTYVPAIEVSGYTEYFESQKEEHPS